MYVKNPSMTTDLEIECIFILKLATIWLIYYRLLCPV